MYRFRQIILVLLALALSAGAAAAQEHINPLTSTCWFTALETTPTYNDPQLTIAHSSGVMEAGQSLQVIEVQGSAALVAIDHAMGFWVSSSAGRFSGVCEDTDGYAPVEARALANARLWSQPDVVNGSVVVSVPEGAAVEVTGGPVVGRIRYDLDVTGAWYPARYGVYTGWVWAERIAFEDVTLPDADAYALANARLWTQPDVLLGAVAQEIAPGAPVEIVGGPVVGRIRYDEAVNGVWYQVQVGSALGWVWENRLRFE